MDKHLAGRRAVASSRRSIPSVFGVVVGLIAVSFLASPAFGWTPTMQKIVAREGARLAPNDLYRQIQKYPRELEEGAVAPFQDGDPLRHVANADGTGQLEDILVTEVERTIQAIQAHVPFERVVYQLGVIAHYVADANNPLNTSSADGQEARFFADYLRYLESAEPRLPVIFYGLYPDLEDEKTVAPLLAHTLRRGRELYPMVGREYRRIGFQSGVGRFDDRSTAFGVASLAFSHAATDVGLVFRYIWLRSGGGDFRVQLPTRGEKALRLPRLPTRGPLSLPSPGRVGEIGGGGAVRERLGQPAPAGPSSPGSGG